MSILNNAYMFLLGLKMIQILEAKFSITYQNSLKCKYSLTSQFYFIKFFWSVILILILKPYDHIMYKICADGISRLF